MDDYKKISEVGRGAHSVCWLCKRKNDIFRRKVVIKTMDLEGLTQEKQNAIIRTRPSYASISDEVTLLKRLHHPHIIGYYESFKIEKSFSIVMEYAEGGTVDKMIAERGGIKFLESIVLNYFTQV
ncbi:hypothetical protein X798_07418, partial [Onchocerca flexuosa]